MRWSLGVGRACKVAGIVALAIMLAACSRQAQPKQYGLGGEGLATPGTERDFAVNLKQHWYVARSVAHAWTLSRRPGALAVVASVSGLFSAVGHGAYGAAKAGLLAFVRTAAEEWWPHGIRVNAVVPGSVRTPRIEALWASGGIPQPGPETLERMALPEDVAHAAVFLVSDLARRVTGQTLVVDGGTTTRFPYAMG